MDPMRRLTLAFFLTLLVTPLVAQVHEATPLDVLMERVHMMAMPGYTEAQPAMLPIPELRMFPMAFLWRRTS